MKRYLLGLLVEKDRNRVDVSLGIYFIEASATFKRRGEYVCPKYISCSQTGCRHKRPHTQTVNCVVPERGGILNGCKSPCRKV